MPPKTKPSKMRELLITEDEHDLFSHVICAQEFLYYVDHKDAFRTMWMEQGSAFWINTIIKYRIFTLKHSLLSRFNHFVRNGAFDYAFIKIAEKMTGGFGDVTELMYDSSIVARNMHLAGNMIKPSCAWDPFVHPTTRNSFRNLFGPPDTKLRILRTFILAEVYVSWAGALVRILNRWMNAAQMEAPSWSPACSYTHASSLHPALFERYLKQKWGDRILEVCGAPPERLVWWVRVSAAGPLELDPWEEFTTLADVLETKTGVKDGTCDVPAEVLLNTEPTNLSAPLPRAANDKKKKKKGAKKGGKGKARAANGGESDRSASPAAVRPAALALPGLDYPGPTAVVRAALADWHEYVPAAQQPVPPLRAHLLGGCLQLAWIVLTLEDNMPRLAHVEPTFKGALKLKITMAKEWHMQAAKAAQESSTEITDHMRRERDAMSLHIHAMRTEVDAVLTMRFAPDREHAVNQLDRVRLLVKRALDDVLLRLFPAIFQYSFNETPGDDRLLYPDFDRTRYLLKKAVSLCLSPVPREARAVYAALVASLDWYSELARLPDLVRHQVRTQLRPGGLLAARLRDEQHYDNRRYADIKNMHLGKTETLVAVRRVFSDIRALQRSPDDPCPPAGPDATVHSYQSIVDFYWAKLASMLFCADLLSTIPCSKDQSPDGIAFKDFTLGHLFFCIVSLQIEQWRWLYPRVELDLPKRPAFSQPAAGKTVRRFREITNSALRKAHHSLQHLYSVMMSSHASKGVSASERVQWNVVHFHGDECTPKAKGSDFSHPIHEKEVIMRHTLRALTPMLRLEVWSGKGMDAIVDGLHELLQLLIAVQDCHLTPTVWSGVETVEKLYKKAVKSANVREELEVLERALLDMVGPGPKGNIEPQHMGPREANIREFMLTACHELSQRLIVHAHDKKGLLDQADVMATLDYLGEVMDLKIDVAPGPVPLPGEVMLFSSRLDMGRDWPALVADADRDAGHDWWRWVVSAPRAADWLAAPGRPPLDQAAAAPCVRRACLPWRSEQLGCGHTGADRHLCIILNALRNIKFLDRVVLKFGESAAITVHQTMRNVLEEAWLPYALAVDHHFNLASGRSERIKLHSALLDAGNQWVEQAMAQLYRERSKMGSGKMQRADRSWLNDGTLRPDITVCRTISWTQACDLHMEMMRSVMHALCHSRQLVPPIVCSDHEVHPAPLALLEMVETGAVMLLLPFLEYRDGWRSQRQLVDVAELGPEVALALDLRGWLDTVATLVTNVEAQARLGARPVPEPSALMKERTRRALELYERPLRDGSLLEFLALRQGHAEPLRWAVRAHLIPRNFAHDELLRHIGNTHFPLTLPPMSELHSRPAETGSLHDEWEARLLQLERVLSAPRPQLLDSVLVLLDYELQYGKLTDIPPLDGKLACLCCPREDGKEATKTAIAKHVFKLGDEILMMTAAGKTFHYRTRKDHVITGRQYFKRDHDWQRHPMHREMYLWALTNVSKVPRTKRGLAAAAADGKQVNGIAARPAADGGDREPDAGASAALPPEPSAAIRSLTRQLESLLTSTDQLRDIPEEPLDPAVLRAADRHASQLAAGLQRLPDGQLKRASRQLAASVQRAVSQPADRASGDARRQIAGSEMELVDACLSKLSCVLSEHNIHVTKPEPVALRECSFCDRRESSPGEYAFCSLCKSDGAARPRAYCGVPCQTDDWEMGHWEDHQPDAAGRSQQ